MPDGFVAIGVALAAYAASIVGGLAVYLASDA